MFTIIEKIKVPVNILNNDNTKDEITHLIFLTKGSDSNAEETIKDFLNNNYNSFIPSLIYETEDKTVFRALNVNGICYVKDIVSPCNVIEIKKEILIIFANGHNLKVAIDADASKNQNRVLDYLNSSDNFLEFQSQRDKVYVNKNLIIDVTEIG